MQMMVRRIRVIVTGLVVAGIVASGVATCTAGAMAPEMAQMACCTAEHHTCGKDGAPADCCKENVSSAQPQWNVVAKADSLNAPTRLLLALVTPVNSPADVAFLVRPARVVDASPPLRPQGPPLYIAFSTLLI